MKRTRPSIDVPHAAPVVVPLATPVAVPLATPVAVPHAPVPAPHAAPVAVPHAAPIILSLAAPIVLLLAALVPAPARAELFLDLGVGAHRIESKIANRDDTVDRSDGGLHLGIGARRSINERSDFGFRLEADTIDSDLLLAVRAFDYRRHASERVAYDVFLGVARLDLATPAYGYYLGAGVQWKNLAPSWDLNVDLRLGDKVARDNLLPSDPQGGSPDNFHDVTGITVYLSRRF